MNANILAQALDEAREAGATSLDVANALIAAMWLTHGMKRSDLDDNEWEAGARFLCDGFKQGVGL